MNVASSPIFLNSAGNVQAAMTGGIRLLYSTQLPVINQISGTDVVVKSIYAGVPREESYASLSSDSLVLFADANTPITITGDITKLSIQYDTDITKLKCSNTALKALDCSGCTGLTSLDLSTNTALNELSCSLLDSITEIKTIATNEDVATAIAGAITGANADDGKVYVSSDDTYYSTVADAAVAKGWTVEAPAA